MSARQAYSTVSPNDYHYMNENQIDIELKCAVCQQPFVNPMVGKQCGHTFCDFCIGNWYKQDSSCPTCRQRTTFKPLSTRVVLSQLDRLLVRCPQCNESNIQRGNFTDHIQHRCRQTILRCGAADLKCRWTGNREQYAQHAAICPLLQIRPVVEELRTELSALSYQLQIFMDEMRDQLNYLHQQSIPRAQANRDLQKNTDRNNLERARFDEIKNDLRHTWRSGLCGGTCNFCNNYSKKIFTCLICSRSAALAHICAHDSSGDGDSVICRICFEKYGHEIYFV